MDTKKSINKYGQIISSSSTLHELLLQGRNINNSISEEDEDIRLYRKYQKELLISDSILNNDESLSEEEFHQKCTSTWNFPKKYHTLDVKALLLSRCKTSEEIDRVNEEYELYEKYSLIMLLRLFVFLVDYMRENKFIWGVGRGSSVSSYILYLLEVHRVNSLQYGLPVSDFLK